MPSSALIRVPQSSLVNQNNFSTNTDSGKRTKNMLDFLVHMFKFINLLNTKLYYYLSLFVKQILKFVFGFWTFAFVAFHGSKRKVKRINEIF